MKAYKEIGESYLNLNLITWDDSLITFFIFRNARSHIYLEKYGYSWNIGTTGSIDFTSKIKNDSKIVNKRFHDVFNYLNIIYKKTENNEIDRKSILVIWDALYSEFNAKINFLTKEFDLIKEVFKSYMNISYMSKKQVKNIKSYFKIFIEVISNNTRSPLFL